MVQGKQQLTSARNALSWFRDTCDTDDGRWTDGRRTADDWRISISWALLTESSRAKTPVYIALWTYSGSEWVVSALSRSWHCFVPVATGTGFATLCVIWEMKTLLITFFLFPCFWPPHAPHFCPGYFQILKIVLRNLPNQHVLFSTHQSSFDLHQLLLNGSSLIPSEVNLQLFEYILNSQRFDI